MGKKQNFFQGFMKKATNRMFFVVGALFFTISAFAATPELPKPLVLRIFVYPDVLEFAINKHISVMYRNAVATEWQNRMGTDGSVTADDIRAVCQIAHLNTNECNAFQKDLMTYFYDVCDKGKGKSGGKEHCVNDFQSLTTNMLQAVGLAKLYAYKNDNVDKLVCKTNPRIESHTTHSGVRGGMNAGGMPSSTTTNHYVQCRAVNKNLFYEFKFSNTRGTSDNVNHRSFKTGICSVYGYKFQGATKKDNREKSGWDICDGTGINTANCEKINNGLSVAHTGYFASWGPKTRTLSTGKHGRVNEAGAGYKLDASNLPYCILTANAGIKYDGTAYERTAFGLNGRYFLSKDIQTQGTEELHEYIRKYVQSTGVKIESFSCENTYVTVQLAGRSDPDDMITCTINGSTVDFFFDDLSESKGKYIRGAKQALDCKVAGGTFTGSKCMGLNEEQCGIVRAANAKTCPECSKIQWNSIDKICELPASASAQNLRRGLTYAAMVGGATVSVVITVGTLGTATAPTAVVLTGLAVELLGAGIELKAQKAIDAKADEFFVKANNCKKPDCAEQLIKEYLQALSNQQNDLSDTEIEAADHTFEDLFEIIPADSKFYKDIVELGIKSQNLEGNKRGLFDAKSWNSEQIWRAVGVTLQVIPTLASIGWRIAKKSDKLVRSTAKLRGKIETASKHIDDALKIQKTKNLDIAAKQLDDLLTQQRIQKQKIDDMLVKYDFGSVSTEAELAKWHELHPDFQQAVDLEQNLTRQIKTLRYENPGLWVPGEDVANYYDVESLQKRLKEIADEDADYIAELKRRQDELYKTRGIPMYTDETKGQINQLRDRRNEIVQDALRPQGLSDDIIRNVGLSELDELEQILRAQDPELERLYQNYKTIRKTGTQSEWMRAMDEYDDRLLQYPEYKDLYRKTRSARDALFQQQGSAREVIVKENADVVKIDEQIKELEQVYSPEYEDILNEREYIGELIRDAEMTVGDKQNLAWWDAIPQQIKDKYAAYMDDKMIEIMAQDPGISVYIKNWDVVKNSEELYSEFLKKIETALNKNVFSQVTRVQINTSYNPYTSTKGSHMDGGAVDLNSYYYMGKDVEGTVGTVKHEILGHHVDEVLPDYGLQGTTMQRFVESQKGIQGFKKITSHGNADPVIIEAKSPILGTSFSISDASEATKDALRKDGWTVRDFTDRDTYARYRAEMTEREAWSITPTSDVEQRVDGVRESKGLPKAKKIKK